MPGLDVISALVKIFVPILLLPHKFFIHVDIYASKARAQISQIVETFLNLMCIPSLNPILKACFWKEADVKYQVWLSWVTHQITVDHHAIIFKSCRINGAVILDSANSRHHFLIASLLPEAL